MDTIAREKRVSPAPQGRELVVFIVAAALLALLTVAFIELLLIFTVTLLASMVLASSLAAFEDRVTGKTARFALAIAIVGLLIASYAGLLGATMSSLGDASSSSVSAFASTLASAMFLGGGTTLLTGIAVGAYFARTRGAGGPRLRWIAAEASVYATLAYMGVVVLSAVVRGVL